MDMCPPKTFKKKNKKKQGKANTFSESNTFLSEA